MGLDMHLTATRDVYADSELAAQLTPIAEQSGFPGARLCSIEFEVMYWRKANAIHKWFVDNVQEGIDECEKTPVSLDDLRKLKSVIDQVLADQSLAAALLPPQSGFFFGSTEINEWYWRELEETQQRLEQLVQVGPAWEFFYQSSW